MANGERRTAEAVPNRAAGIARPSSPRSSRTLLLAAGLLGSSCGKKGDPSPPFPRGPRAITDLAIEQEGADAVLTFSYPDRLMSGLPLTDLASIEVYRLVNPSPSLTAARKVGPAPAGSGAARNDEAPAAGARQAAVNASASRSRTSIATPNGSPPFRSPRLRGARAEPASFSTTRFLRCLPGSPRRRPSPTRSSPCGATATGARFPISSRWRRKCRPALR